MLRALNVSRMICEIISRAFFLSSVGSTCQGAMFVLVALKHFLIVGTVEDANSSAFRQTASRAPEKIMVQFLRTGMLETEHLTSLGIDPRHHVSDGAVFSGGVNSMQYQQQGMTVGRVVHALQRTQLFYLFFEVYTGLTQVGHFPRLTFSPSGTRESLLVTRVYLHAYDSVTDARVSIMQYLDWYNRSRPHSKLEKRTLDEAYAVMLPTVEQAA